MNTVEPIKNTKDINNIKRYLKGRNRLMFTFGINSALRISDILNLKIGDVLDNNGKPRDGVEIKEKKTRKSKRFKFNDTIIRELKKLEFSNRDEYLFKSRKGTNNPISRVQAYRIIQKAADEVGIEDVNIGTHSLRKTFGYHAYDAGVPLERLQAIFNHSSQSETLRYIGITQENLDEVYVSINL